MSTMTLEKVHAELIKEAEWYESRLGDYRHADFRAMADAIDAHLASHPERDDGLDVAYMLGRHDGRKDKPASHPKAATDAQVDVDLALDYMRNECLWRGEMHSSTNRGREMSMTTPTTSRVSDEMVETACEANELPRYWEFQSDRAKEQARKSMRRALEAALASQGDVVAVSEVQSVVDEMDKVDQMLDQGEAYASNAVEDIVYHYQLKLSAILSRGGK